MISTLILQGDSGGPATYKHGDQHVLAGVIDFGKGRAGVLHNNHDVHDGQCINLTAIASIPFLRTDFIDKILDGATVCKHGVEADDWF